MKLLVYFRTDNVEMPYVEQLKILKNLLMTENLDDEVVIDLLGNSIRAQFSVPTALFCFLRAQQPIESIQVKHCMQVMFIINKIFITNYVKFNLIVGYVLDFFFCALTSSYLEGCSTGSNKPILTRIGSLRLIAWICHEMNVKLATL